MAYLGGIALAAVAALCNGSFGTLAKVEGVTAARVPPHIFNFWACLGIIISSLPVALLTTTRCLSLLGLLSGTLFVTSTACAFSAMRQLGLSLAAGIWCGTAVLVSFAFGAVVESGVIVRPLFAGLGIGGLLLGILGIAVSGMLADRAAGKDSSWAEDLQDPLLAQETGAAPELGTATAPSAAPIEGTAHLQAERHADSVQQPQPEQQSWTAKLLGVATAVATGLLGGLILAPMDYAPHECRGLPYLPSMAAGVLLAAPIVTYAAHWLFTGKVTLALPLQPLAAAGPGLSAGIIWNVGNAASMVAVQLTSLAIAYPIMQSGLFIAGLWGILFFGELRSVVPQLLYWASGALLLSGVMLLALAG